MNYLALIPCWQRAERLEKVLGALARQHYSWDVHALCAIDTETDPQAKELVDVVNACPIADWERISNQIPLGDRFNLLAEAVTGLVGWDVLMILGSDNVVSHNFLEACTDHLIGPDWYRDFWGWQDFYMYEPTRLVHWPGYTGLRKGESIGAGRCLTRDTVETLQFKLYPDGVNRSIDKAQAEMLEDAGISHSSGPLPERVYLVDCKDAHSITPLKNFDPKRITDVQIPESIKKWL